MATPQDLPIDIHSGKLLDWLVSRRHCNRDWQKNILSIREKINAAIQDMPEDERIVTLLQGTYINYFHCKQIVDILKETEKDTKNFLGYYSSQRMNDWLNIQSLYEANSIGLAESAQILQRLVQYEIPTLKKQIAKCSQNITDNERKEVDYSRLAADGRKQFEKEKEALGIEGRNFRREFLSLAKELPEYYAGIADKVKSLSSALQYYYDFRTYLHDLKEMPRDLLPVCSLLMEGDRDVTVYELKHRKKPTRIERPSVELLEELSETVEAEDGEAEIDFGADEIDFDGADLSLSGIAVVGDSQGEIDDGVARGSEALPLLENDETQQLIKAELKELQAFLSFRRMDEVTESACDIYIAGLENRPAHLSKISVSQIDEQLQKLNEILALLNDPQKIHLFKIRSSPHYIESLVESLEQKKSLEEKYNQMKNLMVERSNDLRKETVAAQNKLKQVAEQTRILQKQIENEISKKYNGRPVNIMGGISAALDMT